MVISPIIWDNITYRGYLDDDLCILGGHLKGTFETCSGFLWCQGGVSWPLSSGVKVCHYNLTTWWIVLNYAVEFDQTIAIISLCLHSLSISGAGCFRHIFLSNFSRCRCISGKKTTSFSTCSIWTFFPRFQTCPLLPLFFFIFFHVFLPQSLEQIPPCMGVWCFFSWFLHGFSMVFPLRYPHGQKCWQLAIENGPVNVNKIEWTWP